MLSHEQYLKKFNEKWNEEYSVLGIYVKSNVPILVRHNLCGREYEKVAFEALRYGCKHCAREILEMNLLSGGITKTQEQFKKDLAERFNGEYELSGEYKKNKHRVKLKHNICGK